MKIFLDIPGWCEKEHLYLLTRNELVASKMVGAGWKIKKTRCGKCGRCCMVHPKEGAYFAVTEDGACVHLAKEGENFICSIGMEKPLACVLGEPEGPEHKKFNCSIEY